MEAQMAKMKWDPVPDMIGWNKIKALREARGLSQAEVAVGAGVAVTTVYFLEMGYEKKTTEEVKKKIADFFKCDGDDIFPAEMIGNVPRDEFVAKAKKQVGQPKTK
jgi:DNA-binding XRE family transcriptional regulator